MKKEYNAVLNDFYDWVHQTYTLPIETLVKQTITFNFGRTIYTFTDCDKPTLCDHINVEAGDLSMVIMNDTINGSKFYILYDENEVYEVLSADIANFKKNLNDMMGIMENITERSINYISNGVFDYYS
jgi:hypothetical protein